MSGRESGQACFPAVLEIFEGGVNEKNENFGPRESRAEIAGERGNQKAPRGAFGRVR